VFPFLVVKDVFERFIPSRNVLGRLYYLFRQGLCEFFRVPAGGFFEKKVVIRPYRFPIDGPRSFCGRGRKYGCNKDTEKKDGGFFREFQDIRPICLRF
jgi:hypothetical protein